MQIAIEGEEIGRELIVNKEVEEGLGERGLLVECIIELSGIKLVILFLLFFYLNIRVIVLFLLLLISILLIQSRFDLPIRSGNKLFL